MASRLVDAYSVKGAHSKEITSRSGDDLAQPKSASTTSPKVLSNMLDGLTSRCMTLACSCTRHATHAMPTTSAAMMPSMPYCAIALCNLRPSTLHNDEVQKPRFPFVPRNARCGERIVRRRPSAGANRHDALAQRAKRPARARAHPSTANNA